MSKKSKKIVYWSSRYSITMENDDKGRWARIAHAGNLNLFHKGKKVFWDIAWVEKFTEGGKTKFLVKYYFPNSSYKAFHNNLEDAKKEVEKNFKWFIKICAANLD